MRTAFVAVTLMLAACSGGWPSRSYAPITEGEAQSVAPFITSYLAGALPAGSEVTFDVAPKDPIEPMLNEELQSAGLSRSGSAGHRVSYVVTPVGDGVLLRVSLDDTQGMSRYFIPNQAGELYTQGPSMVAVP